MPRGGGRIRVATALGLLAATLLVLQGTGAGRSAASAAQAAALPVNTKLPGVSGTTHLGQTLKASPGTWSGSPTGYLYRWRLCSAKGTLCKSLAGATSASYVLGEADVGETLSVSVTAVNAAGRSRPAISLPSAIVTNPGGVQHLEYVFNGGLVYVYSIDEGERLLKTISLPQTAAGVRGETVAPASHMLFIFYGGDGLNFNGSVLAYNLLEERVVWTVNLNTGIDSGQVSPDGTRLYVPTGENSPSGIWNILSTANGALLGTITGGSGAHNTVASGNGRYVYLGSREYNYLDVYETASGHVRGVGPLLAGVRPFTVNGSNTLAFTTATGVDGFQVSNIATGKVLFSVNFGAVPVGYPFTAPSHGVSLSPDEKELYVVDSPHREVRVYDVSAVAQGVAPKLLASIRVAGLTGSASPCAYDCERAGWLQRSLDGRYVFVGDSGAVIETATHRVIASISTLLNTKMSLEIDWQGGVPIATSGRTGVGEVP